MFGADGNHRISMGMSMGLINRRFDPSKFQTSDMWDPQTGLNPSLGGDEVLSKTSGSNFDAGAGIMYYDATPGKKMNLFAGFSAFHLTRPEDPFITDGEHQKMPVRYTAHGGAQFNISEGVSLTPNILYMRQGQATEKMLGAYTLHPFGKVDPDTTGVPMAADIEVRVDNPDVNGVGEIVVRHPNMYLGYYKNPEASAADMKLSRSVSCSILVSVWPVCFSSTSFIICLIRITSL
jgi:acyl-CoA synthetase (AMP-forming)/AMP-acid ligase II